MLLELGRSCLSRVRTPRRQVHRPPRTPASRRPNWTCSTQRRVAGSRPDRPGPHRLGPGAAAGRRTRRSRAEEAGLPPAAHRRPHHPRPAPHQTTHRHTASPHTGPGPDNSLPRSHGSPFCPAPPRHLLTPHIPSTHPERPSARETTFDLPDAAAARQAQLHSLGEGGPYGRIRNSCVDNCGSILQEGGADISLRSPIRNKIKAKIRMEEDD